MAVVNVHVEYCGAWGYGRRFEELKRVILSKVPSANVTGATGRKTSFEVTVNDQVVFSKLKANAFPDFAEVADQVDNAAKGNAVQEVTGTQSSSCSVM